MPKPKDEFLNHTLFIVTYVIHKVYFDIFQDDRKIFGLRFVLDCYHEVIQIINGHSVTDFYL